MSPFTALMIGFVLGLAAMFAGMQIADQFSSDRAAERRSAKRRLLALEDRPDRASGAVGTARVRTANLQREVRGE